MFVMLNIVKGITIDTFVEIRYARLEREIDKCEVCFLCGLRDIDFNRKIGQGAFLDHLKTDHNLWHYFFYIFFIWEQDRDDDDGLEFYVRSCIDEHSITWFPIGHSLSLQAETSDENNFREKKFQSVIGEGLSSQVQAALVQFSRVPKGKIFDLRESMALKAGENRDRIENHCDTHIIKDFNPFSKLQFRVSITSHLLRDPNEIIIVRGLTHCEQETPFSIYVTDGTDGVCTFQTGVQELKRYRGFIRFQFFLILKSHLTLVAFHDLAYLDLIRLASSNNGFQAFCCSRALSNVEIHFTVKAT
jgi:hypothetical protein